MKKDKKVLASFFLFFISIFIFPDFGKLTEESVCITMKLSTRLDQHNFQFFEICTV